MQLPRSSGILMHPSSLPGGHGIGDLGAGSRAFVDRLHEAGQSWWQILPLNPPDYLGSPYSSASAMACNPLLIDLVALAERGWLEQSELEEISPALNPARLDIELVTRAKLRALRTAFSRADRADADFVAYCEAEAFWLDHYALFDAIKVAHGNADWRQWPEPLVRREPAALKRASRDYAEGVEFTKFCQWVFDRQWSELRAYAASRDVRIIGDVPIFVAMDSVDVWAHRELFRVDENGQAEVVAGVPPDYFSPTGQKWGNPIYRWDVIAKQDFAWWKDRVRRVMSLVDLVRIDHFRGFEAYWITPEDAPTAINGAWRPGPGAAFFQAIRDELGEVPFIAEDLGMITPAVHRLRDRFQLPGMKILQFAFEGDPNHAFLPHTYPTNCVAYTGTHDNDTTLGWYRSTTDEIRHNARVYLSHPDRWIVWALITALMGSRANLVVVPTQDLYELGTEARMNFPGTSEGNWTWRLTQEQLDDDGPWKRLGQLTNLYGR